MMFGSGRSRRAVGWALIAALGMGPVLMAGGCESAPGNKEGQAAVGGGTLGAVVGAIIAKQNRIVGGIVGGFLGAGGGYLIGAQMKKNDEAHKDDALRASQTAETNPARIEDVHKAETADLNGDGFVTLDEVVAMHDAGLPDVAQVARLQATGEVFELTAAQEQYLRDRGISRDVVDAMRSMNQPAPADHPPVRNADRPLPGQETAQGERAADAR